MSQKQTNSKSLGVPMAKIFLTIVTIISLGTVLVVIEYLNMKYPSSKMFSIFTICPNTVRDIDNNVYKTIKIGPQCWLKQNLKVTKNQEGKAITRYCYDNDPKICETDGGLYDWNTAMNKFSQEGTQGICPNGWHIPRASEWQTLKKSLPTKAILEQAFTDCVGLKWSWNYCSPEQEKQMKSIEIVDYSSFDLLFSGFHSNNTYSNRNESDFFWSSTENGRQAWSMRIDSSFYRYTYLSAVYTKGYLFSVRCLKD